MRSIYRQSFSRDAIMKEFNIILFICNWGARSAYQILQDERADIPNEIKMIRIPCTGRISKSLLFKAFEMGADGVALVGCKSGSCRYGSGTGNAEQNTRDTREILDVLGLGKDRMRQGGFLSDEPGPLLEFLQHFRDEIRAMGPSPVTPAEAPPRDAAPGDATREIVDAHDVFACQDCGKCTSACSLALAGKPFSPRAFATAIIAGDSDAPGVREDVNACLTCGLCYDRCPSAVNFPEFIKEMRHYFKRAGENGQEAHGGFFQSLMRAMTSPELHPRRWRDIPDNIALDPKSDVLFYGGCAPYFDIFFRKFLKVDTGSILADSLRLLNFFDIQPALLNDERCCGHDLLWSGDRENFLRLARLNAESIRNAGVKEVVTACPECHRALSHEYPEHGVELNLKITHLYDFLDREIGKGAVAFKKIDKKLTFQDSCRMSRHEGRADLPRKLIRRLEPAGFTEMRESGSAAVCCGNSAWTGCDAFSKALQVKRLAQARETGCDLLLTACPKCQIHLRCAMEDPIRGEALDMEMMDVANMVAKTIYWE